MCNPSIKLVMINLLQVLMFCACSPENINNKFTSNIVCDTSINCEEQVDAQQLLSDEQKNKAKNIIAKALDNIARKNPGNGVNKFYNSTRTVFTIEELPGLIFKQAKTLEESLDNSRKAQFAACVVKHCNLFRLAIPKIESITVESDAKEYYFTAEQMLDIKAINGSFDANESQLYKDVLEAQSNANELAKFRELFDQRAIFSLETNYSDFKFDNEPLLKSAEKDQPIMGLVDLEHIKIGSNRLKKNPQKIIQNISLPYIFLDSTVKTLQGYLGRENLWPNYQRDIENFRKSCKERFDYFAHLFGK